MKPYTREWWDAPVDFFGWATAIAIVALGVLVGLLVAG